MRYKNFFTFLLMLIFVTSCKKDVAGKHFSKDFQKVWQDTELDYFGIYFTDTEIIRWYYDDIDDNDGADCYYEKVQGKLDSYKGDAFRVFMYETIFTGRKDVEETLYFIIKNNNWLYLYGESDTEADYIWFETNRSIEPLCVEE